VVDPGVGGVGQDFALEVGLDILMQGDVLGVAEVAVRLWVALGLVLGDEDYVAVCTAQGSLDGDGAVREPTRARRRA
jgi:hypothetical protein